MNKLSLLVFLVIAPLLFSLSCAHHSSHINWYTDEASAFEQAAARNVPVVMDFSADWCGSCRTLERKVFQDPRVVGKMKRFVPLVFNVSKNTTDDWHKRRKYGIKWLPTVLILDPKGRVLKKLNNQKGVQNPEIFLTELDTAQQQLQRPIKESPIHYAD